MKEYKLNYTGDEVEGLLGVVDDNFDRLEDIEDTFTNIQSQLDSKLSKTGGAVTGRITRSDNSASWIKARDYAIVAGTSASSTGYMPVTSSKTTSGNWTMGTYSGTGEKLVFSYTTDTNYNAGTNNGSQVYLESSAGTIMTTANWLNKIYPVGSVYISYVSTSPNTLFGGTWTAITGRFPYFNAGTGTGGANAVTLSVAQMPSHSHTMNVYGAIVGWSGNSPCHFLTFANTMVSGVDGINMVNFTTRADGRQVINTNGSSSSFNNMPAYQTLYAWRRTA